MLTKSMLRILATLKALVIRYIDEEAWAWDGDGQAIAWDVYPLLNLNDEEVSGFATTSCRPTLWAFRALANRLGVTVPQADWFWHNEPRAQFKRFVEMAMMTRAIVGAPAGHDFGRALGFLARDLKVDYEFNRKGDTIARAYWSDTCPCTGVEVGGCIAIYSPATPEV